jgi:hypothetical protein
VLPTHPPTHQHPLCCAPTHPPTSTSTHQSSPSQQSVRRGLVQCATSKIATRMIVSTTRRACERREKVLAMKMKSRKKMA